MDHYVCRCGDEKRPEAFLCDKCSHAELKKLDTFIARWSNLRTWTLKYRWEREAAQK